MRCRLSLVSLILAGSFVACGADEESRATSSSTEQTSADSLPAIQPPISATPTSASAAGPFYGPLSFDWPIGCAVPVDEVVSKRGDVAVIRYLVRSKEAGSDIEISLEDMTMVELNDRTIPEDALERLIAGFTLPKFLVGSDGVGIRATDLDETFAQMADAGLIELESVTPQLIAAVEETVLAKYWESWVGFWAGMNSIDEQRTETAVPVAIGDTEFTIDVVVESMPSAVTGAAVLRSVQTLEGDEFLRSVGAISQEMAGEHPQDGLLAGDGHRITTIEITTDPATLQPSTVTFTNDIELTMDGATQRETESRAWRFDWANLQCD